MIRTEPGGEGVDPLEVQMNYPRGRSDRPWVMANFVTTIDGATVVDGGSTAINDPDDKLMFSAIRAVPDFVLIGAGTLRAEGYGPLVLDDVRRDARIAARLEPVPHLTVLSNSLEIDTAHEVFSDPEHRVTILTGELAPDDRFAALSDVADVVRLDDTSPAGLLHYMRMARVVLCEGGPSLMGQFVADGFIDEMALTISPMMVSGQSPRLAHGQWADSPIDMRLDRILYGERSLFLRYLRS